MEEVVPSYALPLVKWIIALVGTLANIVIERQDKRVVIKTKTKGLRTPMRRKFLPVTAQQLNIESGVNSKNPRNA